MKQESQKESLVFFSNFYLIFEIKNYIHEHIKFNCLFLGCHVLIFSAVSTAKVILRKKRLTLLL